MLQNSVKKKSFFTFVDERIIFVDERIIFVDERFFEKIIQRTYRNSQTPSSIFCTSNKTSIFVLCHS